MTSLGGRILSDELLLLGLDDAPGVMLQARRTLGGAMTVRSMPLVAGRTLSLESQYHLSHADLVAVKAMEAAGVAVSLVHPRLSAAVLITDVALVAHQEFVAPAAPAADPWYSGTITMIEV